ncbi:minor tail protein [Gordonia phage JSwag]|uniref:minor tail protein n=1 Tax=Gordonia phage JSwag TaxID=1887649 RepID=UPI00084F2293|nr:minor tail protein [Gordonia phage JSwag]AOE44443.1 Lsr2-like DNA bridging protein [Gordonia phage JSwag]WKW87346.1 minor tail protein [Gordonia phage Nebulosus]
MSEPPVPEAPDGAFVIGGGFGQDVTETAVKQMFAVPKVTSVVGAVQTLEDKLSSLPLEALEGFQALVPDGLSNPFTSVSDAVGRIISSLAEAPRVFLSRIVNQIMEIFQGLIVTPINSAVQGIKDWFNGLLNWRGNTEDNHRSLTNMVWSGATSQAAVEDRTEQEVRDAVASLKARSEALRTENELRYRSAVPMYQGLIPGGDVTCSLDDVRMSDESSFPLTQSSNLMAVFRARSDAPRNVITFLARGQGSVSSLRASLWSYDDDTDTWVPVGLSAGVHSQLSVSSEYDWIDATILDEPHSPTVGELMGVQWSMAGTGTVYIASTSSGDNPRIPAYHSVPYGHATITGTAYAPRQLTDRNTWWVGSIPFAQVAPDLGQTYTPDPQYWFDDFNTDSSTMYLLYNGARISNGRFGFSGTTDTTQYLVYKGQLATPNLRIEATSGVHNGRASLMRLGCDQNGRSGVSLLLRGSGSNVTAELSTVSAGDAGSTTLRTTATVPQDSVSNRWALEYNESTKRYYVSLNGSLIPELEWQDLSNLAMRGKGKRSGGLGVSRSLGFNSTTWDNLLMYDV